MNKMKRYLKYLNNPVILYRKILHRLPACIRNLILGFPSKRKLLSSVQFNLDLFKGKMIFIFPLPNCPWGYMFQRPQQLARALAKEGNLVYYMVDTSYPYSPDWDVRGLIEIEDGIFLYNNGSATPPAEIINNDRVVLWQYWPHQNNYVQRIKSRCKSVMHIYDCIDDISTFDSYEQIYSDFETSINSADIVIATSNVIYKQISSFRDDVLTIPNGVEIEDFSKPVFEISDISIISTRYEVVIGYYGAIANWFDFELLTYLSKKHENWGFILVGEVYGQVQEKVNELKKHANIYFFDRVSYGLIPSVLSYFDVGIIPFLINDITLSTSPVKAYEYLAGGKGLVSTALPEVEAIDPQFVAYNYFDFNDKLEQAICSREDEDRIAYLKSIAKKNTWNERVIKAMDALLQEREGLK